MTIGKVIDRILKYHAEALIRADIQKPFAWAVYQTWKWVDEHEKSRKAVSECQEKMRLIY